MKTNKKLWKINSGDGNLNFETRNNVTNMDNGEGFTMSGIALLLLVLAAMIIDGFNFFSLFSSILFESTMERGIAIMAAMVAFEIIPLYLGLALKKKDQGYRINTVMIKIMTGVFMGAIASNIWLRIAARGVILVRNEGGNAFSSAGEAVTGEGALAIAYQVFAASIPIITSIAAGTVSFLITDYLAQEKIALEKKRNYLTESINQSESILHLYEKDRDFVQKLIMEDEAKYLAAMDAISTHKDYLEDYTRLKIAEMIKEPLSTNILTSHRGKSEIKTIKVDRPKDGESVA